MKMNLPNRLTVARLFLVPVYTVIMFIDFNFIIKSLIIFVLFTVTGITDMLDGKIARKQGLVTDFGKFLDPVADKIMVFGALIGLIYMHREEKILFIGLCAMSFIFFFREIAVTSLRMIASTSGGTVIPAAKAGKGKSK